MKIVTIIFLSGRAIEIRLKDDIQVQQFKDKVKNSSGIIDFSEYTSTDDGGPSMFINTNNIEMIDIRETSNIAVPKKGLIFSGNNEMGQA